MLVESDLLNAVPGRTQVIRMIVAIVVIGFLVENVSSHTTPTVDTRRSMDAARTYASRSAWPSGEGRLTRQGEFP